MSKLDDLKIDAPIPKPQRRPSTPWVPWALLIFMLLATAWLQRERLAGWLASEQQPGTAKQPETAVEANAVNTPAAAGPPGSISAAGYLEIIPPGPTVVSGLVAGRVSEVLACPGELVSAGQVVAHLDNSALNQQATILARRVELEQAHVSRLEAGSRSEEISQAEAQLSRVQAAETLAQSELARSEELYNLGVVSRAEFDTATSAANQASAQVSEVRSRLELLLAGTRSEDILIAQALLKAAQAELAQVNWEIAQCTLKAPVGGVVLEQFVQPGDWLAPGTDNPRSGAVLSLFDPTQIQAWVDVSQRDSAEISVGQPCGLTTDAYPTRKVQGTVSRIMPQANLQKNTVQVKISITDSPADFRPELSVKVTFLPQPTEQQADALEADDQGKD